MGTNDPTIIAADESTGLAEILVQEAERRIVTRNWLLVIPLCWWNDLVFNLPVAYGFGYLCSWLSPNFMLPGSIMGYWLSNIAGIIMMQFGTTDMFQDQPKKANLKKELLSGVASSTVYTLIVLALVRFKVLGTPMFFFRPHS